MKSSPKGPKSALFALSLLCVALIFPGWAHAGGDPLRTLVLVNRQDPISLDAGARYIRARNIPASRLLILDLPTSDSISLTDFQNLVATPVADFITTHQLETEIDAAAICWRTPFQVTQASGDANGLSSALYYGYKTSPPPCSIPAATVSAYYEVETAFDRNLPAFAGPRLLTWHVPSGNRSRAYALIDRSALADATHPSGTVIYAHTTDINRNVRWPLYEAPVVASTFLPASLTQQILVTNAIANVPDLMGHMIGRRTEPAGLFSNTFVPGALADHLTSFGGQLSGSSQMDILTWIEAGASASYGTVIEPCNYTSKFPDPRVHFWYARGFSAAEAYLMSVENPYQGVIVGDGLCQPFARPPLLSVTGLATNQTVSGIVNLNLQADGSDSTQRVVRVEVWLDDRLQGVAAEAAFDGSESITGTVDGRSRTYNLFPGDTLSDVSAGLASDLNGIGFFQKEATASAHGDRITLRHDDIGTDGAGVTYSVSTSGARIHATSATPALVNTPFAARRECFIDAPVVNGDTFTLTVDLSSEPPVTLTTNVTAGATVADITNNLIAQLNSHPTLQGPDGVNAQFPAHFTSTVSSFHVFANTPGFAGHNHRVSLTSTSTADTAPPSLANLNSNEDTLRAQGMLFIHEGLASLSDTWAIDTTDLPDGPHEVTAVAIEGSAVRSRKHVRIPFLVDNHALACVLTLPEAGLPYLRGRPLPFAVTATPDGAPITNLTLRINGRPITNATHTATWSGTIPTDDLGAGSWQLEVLAEDNTGKATLSAPVSFTIETDLDADGLADEWEEFHFGDTATADASSNNDSDSASDLDEYLGDSDPLSDSSSPLLGIEWVGGIPRLGYATSTNRFYLVEHRVDLTNSNGWSVLLPEQRGDGTPELIDDAPRAADEKQTYRLQIKRP